VHGFNDIPCSTTPEIQPIPLGNPSFYPVKLTGQAYPLEFFREVRLGIAVFHKMV
jgi:hypothetical protein